MMNTQPSQKRLRSNPSIQIREEEIELDDIVLDDPHMQEEDHVQEEEEHAPTESNVKGKAKISKRSVAWSHFKEIMDSNGNRTHAECMHCGLVFAARPKKNGTTSLLKHVDKCAQNPSNRSKGTPQTHSSPMCVVDLDDVRQKLCRLIIGEELPFDLVQKHLFRDLFASACPTFTVPSRSTVTRDVYRMYHDERERLKVFLKESSQRVCLTTDTWTSIQNVNYMALTVHFIDNQWNMQKRVLNFCTISGHKGTEIARDLEDCLRSWDLCDKVFTVTVDNAKSNDIACVKLQEMLVSNGSCVLGGKNMHMRCSAHIANLIVKEGLKEHNDCITKVRNVVKFVRSSPMRFKRFKEEAQKLKIDCSSTLVSDVPTRWNYTYVMLDIALKYKQVFSRLDTPIDDAGKPIGTITAEEWSKVEVIVDFLQEFYNFTNSVSGSSSVLVNQLYLYIAGIVNVLQEKSAISDDICSSMAQSMKSKCDKYWGEIGKMNVYIFIGMLLDPACKLSMMSSLLQKIYGKEKGQVLAMQVKASAAELFEEYKLLYAPPSSSNEESASLRRDVPRASTALQSFIEEMTAQSIQMSESTSSTHENELDKFLNEELCHKYDVLKWWRQDGHRFPILAKMARDVFAIPVSTVPSESAFSAGGRTVDKFRSNLDTKMVEALLCTQDWIRAGIRSFDKNDGACDEVRYYMQLYLESEKISEAIEKDLSQV